MRNGLRDVTRAEHLRILPFQLTKQKKLIQRSLHSGKKQDYRARRGARRARRDVHGARREAFCKIFDFIFFLNFPQRIHTEVDEVSFRLEKSPTTLKCRGRLRMFPSRLRQPYLND